MKNVTAPAVFAVIVLALGGMPAGASAAEIKALATIALQSVMEDLAPRFEKASGHTLSIHFDSTPNIISRVNSSTPFDVVVVPIDVFKDAAAKARFAPGPTVGVEVRAVVHVESKKLTGKVPPDDDIV